MGLETDPLPKRHVATSNPATFPPHVDVPDGCSDANQRIVWISYAQSVRNSIFDL